LPASLCPLSQLVDTVETQWPKAADQLPPPRLAGRLDAVETDGLAYMTFPAATRSSASTARSSAGPRSSASSQTSEAVIVRRVDAILLEQNDEWSVQPDQSGDAGECRDHAAAVNTTGSDTITSAVARHALRIHNSLEDAVIAIPACHLYPGRSPGATKPSSPPEASRYPSFAMPTCVRTRTVWSEERAMRSFMLSGAHWNVMPRLAEWCDEAAFADWIQGAVEPPSWPEA
jgi:hypothetical protein